MLSDVLCRKAIWKWLFSIVQRNVWILCADNKGAAPLLSPSTMTFVTLFQHVIQMVERSPSSFRTLYLSEHRLPQISHSKLATTMGNQSSKTITDFNFSSTPLCDPQRTELGKPAGLKQPNGETTLTVWECTTCGRRYEDPTAVGPFITPPPITECIIVQTEELLTNAKGGFVNLSIAGGATCDFVRVKYVVDETDLSEQVTEPKDTIFATNVPIEETLLTQTYRTASVQVEERHSRIGRSSGTLEAACDEEDPEDCQFWKAQCNDVDCIFEGNHCRDQCAMAELVKEPESKAPAPKVPACKRGLRFRRSAP